MIPSTVNHLCYRSNNISDAMGENPAYGGANSAFQDQPFPYTCTNVLIFIGCFYIVQTASKMFSADAHMWKKVQAPIRRKRQNMQRLTRACSFCPSISLVFPDNIT